MTNFVYTVHAYRYGNRELHSYSVGVFSTERLALVAAETEEDFRGGKYECEVIEWEIDKGIAGNHDNLIWKVVKPLSSRLEREA